VRPVHFARGQALVEAAVSFPLLVLLLLIVVEGALYVHALHVVLGAAREGAHAAAAEHATAEESVDAGRARAREILNAGLGQYAAALQVTDPVLDGGSVVVEVHGGLPLFFGGPGQNAPVQLPLDARARASREFFRPQGAEGF
jgi:TadE-like protein